jgi:hypothetical protein
MAVPNETLRAMIRDYGGFELSDDELELIRPEIESYLEEMENIRDVDLHDVMSARLLHVGEGGHPDV